MRLCLDIGNSHIFGGLFDNEKIILRFRYASTELTTSDQFGVFLLSVLREHDIEKTKIKNVAICSVVPQVDYSVRSACKKYLGISPFFLQMGAKTGLKILYKNPHEVGADLIAGCVGAVHHYPGKNIIVADMGTATTCMAVSKNKEFHGGLFVAGMRITMKALQSNAAKLPSVEIVKPKQLIGRSTVECMQNGLYYGHLGMLKEMIARITEEVFALSSPLVIGTGGFSHLFKDEKIFDVILPDLVLTGLHHTVIMNEKNASHNQNEPLSEPLID